jgi:alpha-tubulin suppressor-like RCC1 family protein
MKNIKTSKVFLSATIKSFLRISKEKLVNMETFLQVNSPIITILDEKKSGNSISGGKVKFPSDPNMKLIQAGPYHCCTISANNELYSWGRDRMGSTGLPVKKQQLEGKKDRIIDQPR